MTEQMEAALQDAFCVETESHQSSQINPVAIQDVLWDKLRAENRGSFPRWLQELCENHKSTWEANSKGGELNHHQASYQEPLWI